MPCHTLADGILMGAGKCREYQISGVGRSLVNPHSRKALICLPDLCNVAEIQSTVHAVAHHVHRNSDNIDVACALTVSEKCSLHAVGSGKDTEFRIADSAASVIVGMYA